MMSFLRTGISMTALCVAMVSCSEKDEFFAAEGEGRLTMSAVISCEEESQEEGIVRLADSCTIHISSEKGLIRKFNGVRDIPSEMWLKTGEYVAEAWTGDSVPASFEAKYYKGYQPFTIKAGENTSVTLSCGIANVVVSVNYDPEVADALSDYSLAVRHTKGALIFSGDESRKGYFMMPNGVTDLEWELRGTAIDGKTFTKTGVIRDVKRATEYKVNVKYTGNLPDEGGVLLTVMVDEKEVQVKDEFIITAAPIISGVDFDLSETVSFKSGNGGTYKIYISAACNVESLTVSCDKFESLGFSSGSYDFIAMSDDDRAKLLSRGIKQVYIADELKGEYNSVINFSDIFTKSLPAGYYNIEIKVKDANGMSTAGVLNMAVEAVASTFPIIESATLDIDGINVVTPDLVAKVDINVPKGVETLFVEIISESLSPDVLAEVGLASVFDLAHPGDLGEALTDLGFPIGDEVLGKTYLPFDITMFMEVLGLFPGQHQFKLTVTDVEGQTATATLTFLVE